MSIRSATALSGYRPCVGLVVIGPGNGVFLGRRISKGDIERADDTYAWQLPQGGIDAGESPRDAAIRELYEETSISSIEIIAESDGWLSYDLPPETAGTRGWTRRFKGQSQKWFAARFTGDEAEIEIKRPGGGGHRAEFEAWRWERLAACPDLVVPFKRPVYEAVAAEFAPLVA